MTNRLISLKACLAAGFPEASILNLLKFPLNEELVGSKIRSRVKWLDEGEIPSGYFFGLANQRNAKTLVSSVLTADEVEVFSLVMNLFILIYSLRMKLTLKFKLISFHL